MRVRHRRQHALRHPVALHTQLGVHARHHHVEAGQQLGLLVERAVLEDVDLDPGEDSEGGELLVEGGHHVELTAEALGREPLGHGETGGVIGEGDVVVAQVAGGLGHLLDGAAAIRPVRVGVAVALERRPDVVAAAQVALTGGLLELAQVAGDLAGERLADDLLGLGTDSGQLAQPVGLRPLADLVVAQLLDGGGGPAEGLHAVGRFPPSLEEVGDALECLDGAHVVGAYPAPHP